MSDENLLTKEIAEQFLADPDSVNLSEFTAIEEAAAELLASSPNRLDLSGLLSLSDEAALHLAKHNPTGVRFFLSSCATLYLGGNSGDIEITPIGLTVLSGYVGSLELAFDQLEKQTDAKWNSALAIFTSRQDQRLFKQLTEEMEELLGSKDLEAGELAFDWSFDESHGKSAWEVFDEFKDLMKTCGNRTIWLGAVSSEGDSTAFYVFMGSESEVLERLNSLPDKE
jgi:hypothetical protein